MSFKRKPATVPRPKVRDSAGIESCEEQFEVRSAVQLKPAAPVIRRAITVLLLIAWVCSLVHVAREHGGRELGFHAAVGLVSAAHSDEGPGPQGEDHCYDLGTTTGKLNKASGKTGLVPRWIWLGAVVAMALATVSKVDRFCWLRFGKDLPDVRSFGWLFAIQSALPIRGPALYTGSI